MTDQTAQHSASQPIEQAEIPRRFAGVARLYGERAYWRFATAHVLVVGVGGVGSWAVEALARSGVGRLTLIDLDHVAESNINRQLPALEATLGAAKIQVLAGRVEQINPDCQVCLIDDFLTLENLAGYLAERPDWVVDCIDQVPVKAALIAHCREQAIPVVATGGAGGKLDPTRIQVADLARSEQDPLLAKTRRLLRREYGFPRDPKRPFHLSCVYSGEPIRLGDSCERPEDGGLNCAGYGAVMSVTASFGLVAVAEVLSKIAESK